MKFLNPILSFVVMMFLANPLPAQVWQANVSHNGYSCSVNTTSGNITVYAARGMEGSRQALFMKIKIPYNWGSTSTGCVKYFTKNLVSGESGSHESYFHVKNGWLYFTEYLGDWCTGNDRRGNYPCNNYIFTLYEKNDHGRSGGNKTVIDVRFDVLNVSQMKMNEMAFETYW